MSLVLGITSAVSSVTAPIVQGVSSRRNREAQKKLAEKANDLRRFEIKARQERQAELVALVSNLAPLVIFSIILILIFR